MNKKRIFRALLSCLLIVSTLGSFCAVPVFAAGESFSVSNMKYPESLQLGKSFSLRGTVTSETNITKITVGVFLPGENEMKTGYVGEPNTKTFSIRTADPMVVFGALPAGEYEYRVIASNATETDCVVFSSPVTIFTTLSVEGAVYPSSVVEFSSFGVKGTVSSTNTLSKVTVGVYAPDGTFCTGGTASVSGSSYDLKKLDKDVVFGDLAVGSYFYRIIASDGEMQDYVLANVQFSVTDSFTFADFTPPENLLSGTDFLLEGKINSAYTFSSVTAGIYTAEGSEVQKKKLTVSGTSFDLAALSEHLDFSTLAVGDYTFRITASNSKVSGREIRCCPFTVVDSGIETMTLSGANYPTVLEKGASFSINGIISSTGNITSVTVAVYNATGGKVLGKTVSPGVEIYSVRGVDKDIKFGNLAVGSYVYRITATNPSSADKVLLNVSFQVAEAASLSYRDWKKFDPRWADVTFDGGYTLGNKGDLITALAMLAVQAGVRDADAGFTPAVLCTSLAINGALGSAGAVKWDKVPDVLDGFHLVDSDLRLTGDKASRLSALSSYMNHPTKKYAVLLLAGGSQWVACRQVTSSKLTMMDPAHDYTDWLGSYPLDSETRIAVFEVVEKVNTDLPVVGTGEYTKWTQSDDRWGSMKLGNSRVTMASSGCVVTSLAMLAVHYGLQDETTFNPATFLEALNGVEAFTAGGALYWNRVENVLTGLDYAGKIDLTGSASDKAALLGNLLAQGHAVVLNVNRTHWAALRAVKGTKVYIFDPASPDKQVLFDEYAASGVSQAVVYEVSGAESVPLPVKTTVLADSASVRLGLPVILRWQDVVGASGYRLHIYNAKGEEMLGNADAPFFATNEISYITDALPADRYTAVVETVCTVGEHTLTSRSDPFAFEVYASPVERIAVSNITHHSADLTWFAVEGAVGYRIYVDGVLIHTDVLTDTACSLYGLVAYTTYEIEIRALDENGEFARGTHPFTTLAGNGCGGLRIGDTVTVNGIVNTLADGSGHNLTVTDFETTLRYVDGAALNPFGFYYPDDNGTFYYANAVVVKGETSAKIILSDLGVLPDGYEIPDNNTFNANITLTPSISYQNGSEKLYLTLSVAHCTSLGKCALRITYNERLLNLTQAVAADGSILSDPIVLITSDTDGVAVVTVGNATLNDAEGALVTLVFTLLPDQKGSAVFDVEFSSIGAFSDGITYPRQDVSHEIGAVARDVDGDGRTSDADVLALMDAILNKKNLSEEAFSLADMDADGKLTNRDAVLLKRYLALFAEA